MEDALTPRMTVDGNDVYFCQEVLGFLHGTPDWALVRLNRPVLGVEPVRVRRSDKVDDEQPLLVIGHPYGLPKKYDMGGIVRENEHLSYFQANLDTYAGSSGSPVFDSNTLEVEGILFTGEPDFAEGLLCDQSNVLPDDGPNWEVVTRATSFSSMIPSYDVYLGTDVNEMFWVGQDVVTPYFNPVRLQKNTKYYWRIVARNVCGITEGPIWSFRTGISE